MRNNYIKAGDKVLALNLKAGSSSLIRAIVQAYYPDIEDTITNQTHYPQGQDANSSRWHYLVDKTESPTVPVVLVVRDPVERFRSACAETRTVDIDSLLGKLEAGDKVNNHFWPTSRLLTDGCKLYRFESDLYDAATELGLTLPLPNIAGTGIKPDLTPEQLARVEAIYADDIALFNSITEAGQVAPPEPPEPLTEEDIVNALQTLKFNRIAAEQEGFDFNGKHFQTRNDSDVIKITNVGIAAMNPDFQTAFRAADNSWMPMDAATAQAFYAAMLTRGQEIWANFGAKEAQILAATTVEELEAIDLTL
jgi:hypothetical protein